MTIPKFINIDDEINWVKEGIKKLIAHQGYFVIGGPFTEDYLGKVLYYCEELFKTSFKVRLIDLSNLEESNKDCKFLGFPEVTTADDDVTFYRAVLIEDEVLIENADTKPHSQVETITIPAGPQES